MMAVDIDANNVAMILVLQALKIIQVLMLQRLSAVIPAIIVIHLVLLAAKHHIQEHLSAQTNVVNLVKDVIHLVLPAIHLRQHQNVMTPPQMNVVILVIRLRIVILAPDIMIVAVHGNIVRAQLVMLIVPVAVPIAKATTSLIPAEVIMGHAMGIIVTDIVLFHVKRLIHAKMLVV